ncbi:MAG: TonB-dependent receptor, partial [Ignavibacteriaceae bacterium]|nr:TonB-dependent receptor [Ignavibacteriaceae bacterium]
DYRNLISSYFGTFERLTYSRQNDAVGFAKGIDLQLILSTGSFYSWLSYGLLYAKEDKLNDKEGIYPRYTDQRHTFAFVANIDFGASWNFGLRAYYGSGFPYTPKTAIKTNGNWEWKPDKTHSAYLPAYRRVDIRFSKDFLFADSKISLFLDVSNVFNFRNIQGYEYKTPGFSKPTPKEILLWPILPSIGVKYNF